MFQINSDVPASFVESALEEIYNAVMALPADRIHDNMKEIVERAAYSINESLYERRMGDDL